jgi:hypothetical protein
LKPLLLLAVLLVSLPSFAEDCFFCLPNLTQTRPQVPRWPVEYTSIRRVTLERNRNATYCRRPIEMVDTIVLHHSETPSTHTTERINDFHLSRGTPEDPWLMIAYSYAINSPYPGASFPESRVTEGRPLEIVGSHAGTGIFVPMNRNQQRLWNQGQVVCGHEGGPFRVDPSHVNGNRIKANFTTIGIVVIGNYAPFSRTNPNGYSPRSPRTPARVTLDLVARLSCQLQKKHPSVRNLKWHSFYHPTSCPGTLKDAIGQIKTLARSYGCTFN